MVASSVLRLEQRCHYKSVISRRKIHPSFLGTVPVYACYFVTTEFPFIFKIVPVCKVNNLATLVIIKIPQIFSLLSDCSLYFLALKSVSFLRTLLYFHPSLMVAFLSPTHILLCLEGEQMPSLSSSLLIFTSKSFLSSAITLLLSHHLSPF